MMKTKTLYVILVITVILLTVVNQSIIQWSIEKNKSYSTVINIAGRQRMLGQRIMKQLYQATIDPQEVDSMLLTLKIWNDTHQALQWGNDDLNIPPLKNALIIKKFNALNPIQIKLYNDLSNISRENIQLIDLKKLDHLEDQFFSKMNDIVFSFELDAKHKLSNIGIIELSLTFISLLIILLEIIFIFKPSFRKIVEAESISLESKRLYEKNVIISTLNKNLEKKSEELLESKSMLQSMIDNVPLMLAILDSEGKILRANEKFLKLFDLDSKSTLLNNYYYYDLLPPKLLTKHRDLILKGFKGVSSGFEEKITFANKKWFSGYGVYEPIFNNDQVTGLTVFVADITELKTVQEELTRVNDVKTKLFNVISHDLKGPVASLKGVMELLFGNLISEHEFKDLSTKLYNNVNYLYHTIETLFHWTYLQLDQISPTPVPINIKQFTKHVVDHLLSTAKVKNVTIVNDVNQSVYVYADLYQLKIVFNNVLTNAIKFSHNHQEIRINTEISDDYLDVIVTDGGVGMDDETIQMLFSKNSYYTTPGTNQEKGIGLGIHLCIELLKCNKGQLHINSTPGKGTETKIRLMRDRESLLNGQ